MGKRIIYLMIYVFFGFIILGFISSRENKNNIEKNSKEDHCISCHRDLDILPSDFSDFDIHRHVDLSCAGCHGGDSTSDDQEIAMSPEKGFIGIPAKKEIPQFCGRCHSNINIMRVFQPRITTDQVEQYYTSVHGKKLLSGDKNIADCSNCHTAHSILPAKDPRSTVYALNVPNTCNNCHGNKELMNKYNLKSNQLEEYSKSVHGNALFKDRDLGAPACNDCHGNHGAMPPGITSISYVCGTCHVNNMEYYKNSKIAKIFEKLGYHGCEQCHGNHGIEKTNDEMVGVKDQSFCIQCHSPGDEGYVAAQKIKTELDTLKTLYKLVEAKLFEVKQKGMNDIEIGFLLQDAKQKLIQSRTLVHTFDPLKVGDRTQEGTNIANNALILANKEIDEYYTRRNGFAAATFIFLVLVIALYLRIREKEKKRKSIQ